MGADAEAADYRKQQEANWYRRTDELLQQQHQVFPRYHRVELALAVQPLAKGQRHLGEIERLRRGGEQIEQDLEPLTRQRAHRRCKGVTLDHEIPAHRVGQISFNNKPSEPAGNIADDDPRVPPIADAAGFRVTAGDHDIEPLRLYLSQHLRQQGFVVLQIPVHARDVRGRVRQNALDAGRGEAAASVPPYTAE